MEWSHLVKFFAALFAIMNPIGNIPIFLSVTDGKSAVERSKIAVVASSAVAAIAWQERHSCIRELLHGPCRQCESRT